MQRQNFADNGKVEINGEVSIGIRVIFPLCRPRSTGGGYDHRAITAVLRRQQASEQAVLMARDDGKIR